MCCHVDQKLDDLRGTEYKLDLKSFRIFQTSNIFPAHRLFLLQMWSMPQSLLTFLDVFWVMEEVRNSLRWFADCLLSSNMRVEDCGPRIMDPVAAGEHFTKCGRSLSFDHCSAALPSIQTWYLVCLQQVFLADSHKLHITSMYLFHGLFLVTF